MKKFLAGFVLAALTVPSIAQRPLDAESAKALIRQQAMQLPLSEQDISSSIVSAAYHQDAGNYSMIYLHQAVAGIEVYNRILSVTVRPGMANAMGAYLPKAMQLASPANALPKTTPAAAVKAVLAGLGHSGAEEPTLLGVGEDGKKYFFDKGNFAWDKVQVKLQWNQPAGESRLLLCWEVTLPDMKRNHLHQWAVSADDLSAVRKDDLTVECDFAGHQGQQHLDGKTEAELNSILAQYQQVKQVQQTNNTTGSQYLVSPYPAESPAHSGGMLSLRTDPWLLSPAGSNATSLQWHNNGTTVYTYSRGNNVYSQEDRDNNNNTFGTAATSTTALPALTFNPTVNFDAQPTTTSNQQGAIINLFYWNNIMHDLSYLYGFHEVAGNFQVNNQSRGGTGNDPVNADAQDAGGTNNANMTGPADGTSPRMQMYLWNASSLKILKVNQPVEAGLGTIAALEGNLSTTSRLSVTGAKTANLVIYTDAVNGTNSQGCVAASNAAALFGKIALVQGSTTSCTYADKVLAAQNAGAIGVVVISTSNTVSTMTGTNTSITIPSVMIGSTGGANLRNLLLANQVVNVTLNAVLIDGDYDNGVIAHEYTHGISNRYTGGPNVAGCLQNAEQMGEGWSDYFALMTCTNWATATTNDGPIRRPIGNYAMGADIATGPGIRRYPYSTNMTINPWTYAGMTSTGGAVHTIGEIWCTMLWDLTWKMIEVDGINQNLFNPNGVGGNTVALRLVSEGMRLQPCSPGFVDGRNAILKADTLLYGGKYSCAIWQAFARRGLGWSASQGNSTSYTDGVAGYDLPNGAVIRKTAELSSVSQQQEMSYTLKVRCQCSPVAGFSVVDTLAANVTYVSGGSYNASNRVVTFSNISLGAGDSTSLTVRVKANASTYQAAVTHMDETFASATLPATFSLMNTGGFNWTVSGTQAKTGTYSVYASNRTTEEEKYITSVQSYPLTRYSQLSFWHSFNTEASYDGGIVELSTDNGVTWTDAGPYMIQNGYNNTMDPGTVFVLAGQPAFSGSSSGFINTKVDLSSFAGKSLKFRFVFASDNGTAGTGWYVDDIVLTSESAIRNVALLRNANGTVISAGTALTPINGFALPVTWQRFTAVKQQQTALLNWTTAQEQNAKQFVVERSAVNGQFEAIGSKPAAGNTQQPTDYQFVDASPFTGVNLYRIRQEDADGRIAYSEVRSLDFAGSKMVSVSPNPAKGFAQLQYPGFVAGAQVTARLTNTQGQTVSTYKVTGVTTQLRLPAATAAGTYQLVLFDGNRQLEKVTLVIVD